MIEVQGLTKYYGAKCALDHVSFHIDDGEIVGFLGPNGAGKSTTMNIITGYLAANGGSVVVNGMNADESPEKIRKLIGYLPEQPPLYPDMTVKEYLSFVYRLKKVQEPMQTHLKRICEMTGLENVTERVIRNLSKGYKQRVGFAQALMGDPEILILDEPTVGLDPIQMVEIRNMIREYGKNRIVILSSHVLPDVQAVCERMLVINGGKIVADGTTEELSNRIAGHARLMLKVAGSAEAAVRVLSSLDAVDRAVSVSSENSAMQAELQVDMKHGTDAREAIFYALAENRLPIYEMHMMEYSLEEIFLNLTADEKREEEVKNA